MKPAVTNALGIWCMTCEDEGWVYRTVIHDGRDYPDKRGWTETVRVPCPDCVKERTDG